MTIDINFASRMTLHIDVCIHVDPYTGLRRIQVAIGARDKARVISLRSTTPVKYRMTFWRAFNRLKMAPWLVRYIHTGHIHIPNRPTKRTNERTGTRETRERYIILLLLPPPVSRSLDLLLPFHSRTSSCTTRHGFLFSLSLFIFAHSLMRHIASCAGGNDVGWEKKEGGRGGKARERDWIGQSVRESRIEEGRTSRNNVLAHFLKSPPDPRRRGGVVVQEILQEKKCDGRVEI